MLKELKRVFKDTVIYGLGSLLPKAAGIILVPIYTRFLAPADYGIISLAALITSVVSNVMLLGQQGSLSLYLRKLENEGRKDDGGALIFNGVAFVLAVATAATALLLFLGPTITPYVINQKSFTFNPYMRIALLIALLSIPFALIQAVNRSRGQSAVHTSLQLMSFVLNTAITIYFVVVARQGPYGSLKGTFGAALIMAPLALLFLVRNMRFRFSRDLMKQSLLFGLPLVPHYLAGWMLTFSDRWMLSHFRTMDEVGLYSLAYNVSMVLNMVVMAVNTAWGPVYYDLAATEEGQRKLPRLITVYAAAVTLLAMAYLLFSREMLLLLATERYFKAAPLVPIIVGGYFAFAMYAVMSTGIFYANKTKLIPQISAFAAFVNIGLNWFLVPRYGMWAAAWMTLVAYTVMAIAARFFTGKFFPGSFEDVRLLKLVGIFVAVFALNWSANALPLNIWLTLALKAVILIVATGAIVFFDVINISELKSLVQRILDRRKGRRQVEQERDLAAADETVKGSMSDDSGIGGGTG